VKQKEKIKRISERHDLNVEAEQGLWPLNIFQVISEERRGISVE